MFSGEVSPAAADFSIGAGTPRLPRSFEPSIDPRMPNQLWPDKLREISPRTQVAVLRASSTTLPWRWGFGRPIEFGVECWRWRIMRRKFREYFPGSLSCERSRLETRTSESGWPLGSPSHKDLPLSKVENHSLVPGLSKAVVNASLGPGDPCQERRPPWAKTGESCECCASSSVKDLGFLGPSSQRRRWSQPTPIRLPKPFPEAFLGFLTMPLVPENKLLSRRTFS